MTVLALPELTRPPLENWVNDATSLISSINQSLARHCTRPRGRGPRRVHPARLVRRVGRGDSHVPRTPAYQHPGHGGANDRHARLTITSVVRILRIAEPLEIWTGLGVRRAGLLRPALVSMQTMPPHGYLPRPDVLHCGRRPSGDRACRWCDRPAAPSRRWLSESTHGHGAWLGATLGPLERCRRRFVDSARPRCLREL